MGIPFNISAYSVGALLPLGDIVFKSVSAVSTTFAITYNGVDDPIWDDGTDTYQPIKVGDISTVTFANWDDGTEKIVTVNVDDNNSIYELSNTEFINKGLTYINLSACTSYMGDIILTDNINLTTFISPSTSIRMARNLLYINNCNLTGHLDLSPIYGLYRARIILSDNPNLTSITWMQNFDRIDAIYIENISLTELDFSDFQIEVSTATRQVKVDIPSLITFIPPSTQAEISLHVIWFNNMISLVGVLDLSSFYNTGSLQLINSTSNIGVSLIKLPSILSSDIVLIKWTNAIFDLNTTFSPRQIWMSELSAVTSLNFISLNPNTVRVSSTNKITDNPSLTGVLDITYFVGTAALNIYGCPNLTSILLANITIPAGISVGAPINIQGMLFGTYIDTTVLEIYWDADNKYFNISNNNFSTADVNHMLVDLAAHVVNESNGGDYTGRYITINGNNSCIDQTSGGYNGIEAMNTLVSKGFVMNVNVCAEALVFKSTNDVSSNFAITYSGTGTPSWTDGIDVYAGTDVTFVNWDDTTEKTVTVTVDENDKLTQIDYGKFVNINLTYISFAALSALTYRVWLDDNPNLTTFIAPPSTNTLDRLYIDNTGISGTFDLSIYPLLAYLTTSNTGITDFIYPAVPSTGAHRYTILTPNANFTGPWRGDLMYSNRSGGTGTTSLPINVSSIVFSPVLATTPWGIGVSGVQLAVPLDMTMFEEGVSGSWQGSLFTELNFYTGTTPTAIVYGRGFNSSLYFNSMPNVQTIDISNGTLVTGKCKHYNNVSLTSIIYPNITLPLPNTLNYIQPYNNPLLGYCNIADMANVTNRDSMLIYVQDNNMTSAEVNQTLVELDNDALGTYTGRTINIGGTNAAPDSSSGGYDGSAAVTSLVTKGFTVTHS